MSNQERFFERLTALFIVLPCLCLFVGWLKWPFALLVCGILVMSVNWDLKETPGAIPERPFDLSTSLLLWFFLIAFVMVWLSGIGGRGVQYWDYFKHNAVLNDLINHSWPVRYPGPDQKSLFLVHSLPYYLIPALVGKMGGWKMANGCALFLGVIGLWLTFIWFALLVEKRTHWLPIFFMAAGGLDFLGRFMLSGQFPALSGDSQWWGVPWQYSANSTLLFYVPHHALSGWLLTGFLLHRKMKEGVIRNGLFWCMLGFCWSPFVCLGLLPFVILSHWGYPLRKAATLQNVVSAPVIFLIMAAFYSSRNISDPHGWIWYGQSGVLRLLYHYVVFILLEVGVYVILLSPDVFRKKDGLQMAWRISFGVLALLPLYHFGEWNDLVMRASIPSLFILWVMVARTLFSDAPAYHLKPILLVCCLGAMTAFAHIADGVKTASRFHFYTVMAPMDLSQMPEGKIYMGKGDSYFFTHLARSVE